MDERVKPRIKASIRKMVEASRHRLGDVIDLAIDLDEWAWAFNDNTSLLTEQQIAKARNEPERRALTPVGQKEIEKILGLGPSSTQDHINKPTFPKPAAHLQMGRIWWAEEVQAYKAETYFNRKKVEA